MKETNEEKEVNQKEIYIERITEGKIGERETGWMRLCPWKKQAHSLVYLLICTLFSHKQHLLFVWYTILYTICMAYNNTIIWCMFIHIYVCYALSLSHVQLFATPWTVARQAPLSKKFSSQEYWSGLPWLPSGIFPTQGSNPGLLYYRQILYRLSHQGSPHIYISPYTVYGIKYIFAYIYSVGFPSGSVVKNLPAVGRDADSSLGQKDPLEGEMATHCSVLAWEISRTEEPDGLQLLGLQKTEHDLVTEQQQ